MARSPTEYTAILNTLRDASSVMKKSLGDPVKVLKDVSAYLTTARDKLDKIGEPDKSNPAHAEYTHARDLISGLERSAVEYAKRAMANQLGFAKGRYDNLADGVKSEIEKKLAPSWAIKANTNAIDTTKREINAAYDQARELTDTLWSFPSSQHREKTATYGSTVSDQIKGLRVKLPELEKRHNDWSVEYEKRQRSKDWEKLQKTVRNLRF